MGYKPKRTTYRLRFTDDELDGLVIDAKGASTGQMLFLQRLGAQISGQEGSRVDPELLETVVDQLAAGIVDWNVEDDDDQPIPPTKENIFALEPVLLIRILQAWAQALAGVSDDLGKDSTSGESFPEESLPMEISSPSLAS
jgi:hypothetical protein